MVLVTAVLAMMCVYYGYEGGFVVGFMVAIFFETMALVLVYNLLKKTEERVRVQLNALLEKQKENLAHLELLAEKRGQALNAVVRHHPELSDMILENSGELFPEKPSETQADSGRAGMAPS
ncbi:hypothetical protein OOT00_15065 [Desulfobotulus sp. H1]|uniref:Uncharacterized protein n=1 Tax=Desulfobotulus pelophilus TaxID=2823377 RepID=A0ABT3NCV6_9BACT|nr:hypothetical protein [Desulfobotulus pelophilus]MCW7755305.1 hypothetical protein [Desulfobotulus pelophilus]